VAAETKFGVQCAPSSVAQRDAMPGDRISDSVQQKQHAVHRPARHAATTQDISTAKTTTKTTTTTMKLRWKQLAPAATATATTPSARR